MASSTSVSGVISRVETFFDQLKLGYKWKYQRWEDLKVITYRGYGTKNHVRLKGRVLDDKAAAIGDTPENWWQNIANTWRRIETDEIPGATVAITVGPRRVERVTDDDGFFDVDIELNEPLPNEGPWHSVRAELLKPESDAPVVEEGYVLIPRDDAEFVVVSDLDDTVIKTGATDSLRMMRTILLNNAHSRIPFPGVGALYRALERGPDGRGHNPTFYVSSSPWNLYDLFEAFMDIHEIPLGPVFLKDYGFSDDKFFKTGHQGHKNERIRKLLGTYPDLLFVLMGDSGQQDPEIYREIVREHPDRIRAIFVRDVTTPERDREVRAIAREVEELGTQMTLVENSVEAGERAAEYGLIHEEALEEIRTQRDDEERRHESTILERFLGFLGDGKSGG